MIKELVKDLAKYAPSFLVPAIVGLLVIPVVTRLFSPDDYGRYILLTTTITLLTAISVAWLNSSAIRFLPSYTLKNNLGELNSTVVKLMIVSVLSILAILLIVIFIGQDNISTDFRNLIVPGCLLFVSSAIWALAQSMLRAKRKAGWYSSSTIYHSIAGIGIGLVLIVVFDFGIEGLVWGMFISMSLVIPILYKHGMGKISFKEGRIRSSLSWEMVKFGMPVMVVNIVSWVVTLSDRYIIQIFHNSTEVGIYSASMNISGQTVLMIGALFLLTEGPIAYQIWENQGLEGTQIFINKLTRYYMLLVLPVAVGLSVLAKPTVSVLCASEYHAGYQIVPFVVFGAFLLGIASRFNVGLTCQKRTDLMMYCSLITVVLNLALNFVLIPHYGYTGAAVSFLISYAISLLVRIVVSRRFFIWPFPFKSLFRISLASAVMAVVVYLLISTVSLPPSFQLLAGSFSGMIVYGIVLLVSKEFQEDELHVMKNLLPK